MLLTPRARRRRGLSLLEVILSLAIFLTAIAALTIHLTSSTGRAVEARARSQAALHAKSKLDEVRAGALPLEGVPEQELDDDTDFQWSMNVEERATKLHLVTVRVTQKLPSGQFVEATLSQMILHPSIVGSTLDGTGSTGESASGSSSSGSSSTPMTGTPMTGGTTGGSSGTPKTGGTTGGTKGGTKGGKGP